MLKEFLFPLTQFFTPFNIFQYITFRSAYAALTALLILLLLGPWYIRLLNKLKFGERIRQDGPPAHHRKSGTPTMGGLLIIGAVLVSALLWFDLHTPYAWIGLASFLGFGLIGIVDDLQKMKKPGFGVQVLPKLLVQIFVASILMLFIMRYGTDTVSKLYIPFIKTPVMEMGNWYILFGVILLVGTVNAVNLTDGLDGLAVGLVLMAALTFTVLSYVSGRVDYAEYLQIPYVSAGGELGVLSLAVAGACVGFLWFNAHPAELMMGDTGSLALGGVLGSLALMTKKEILLIGIGGMFVLEVLSVILQVISFKLTGKRIFRMAPLHHHFELQGWPESKVVIRLWILGGLFTLISLSTLKIR